VIDGNYCLPTKSNDTDPISIMLPCSSTNLTELAKAARILATLNPNALEGDDLLKAARALAAATAALLNAAAPENIEVGFN
jgi:hypothetical protein